jgi:hypothetical protein
MRKSIITILVLITLPFACELFDIGENQKYNPITSEIWYEEDNGDLYNPDTGKYMWDWGNGDKYNPETGEIWWNWGNGYLYNSNCLEENE